MATKCKNCIHYDVCCEMITKHNKSFFVCGDKGNEGQHYKDKSLVVELPCRCKDCEYAKEIKLECETIYKCVAEWISRPVTANDFCQYAKLKEIEEK